MKCDGCTLCCKLLNISWMKSPAGEYCRECTPGKGCKIYDKIPSKCLNYNCAYVQMPEPPQDMDHSRIRPDNCHVIFERVTDKIMHGLLDPEYDLNEAIRSQIKSFMDQGFSVVIDTQGKDKPMIFAAPEANSDEVFKSIKSFRDGSSHIYN